MTAQPTLATRLSAPGPKRLLALDGGGTRGVIALAFLERIETILRTRHPDRADLRLADYFDLIGGTSTGAIIAAGLALGMTVAQVREMYFTLAPMVFRSAFWRLWAFQARFNAAPLMDALRRHLGTRTLDSPDIRSGLAIVAKRLDTGSPWIVSNSPWAPYWDDPEGSGFAGNRHYELATLVRASAAAPFFFRPERIAVTKGEPPGLFVDGGVSPHNNPALALLMLATMRPYGLAWPTGADSLLLISVGTGQFRVRLSARDLVSRTALGLAARALNGLIADTQMLTLTLLQWMSEPAAPWPLNSELGNLRGDVLGGRPLLAFQRYNVVLEEAALREAGETFGLRDLTRLRAMTHAGAMETNFAIATRAAARQVQPEHFPTGFDLRSG